MSSKGLIRLYHLIEYADGEKNPSWLHILGYKLAERIKLFILSLIERNEENNG